MIVEEPFVQLLLAIAEYGANGAFESEAGIVAPVTIRHSRNRNPVRANLPCITIVFVSDDPRPGETANNMSEQTRELVVDVQADMDLPTEGSNADPTGLAVLSRFIGAFVRALKDPDYPTWLGGKCDWISVGEVDPDERSKPDNGRMTRALRVVYRVRSDNASELLAMGENG